MYAAYMDFQSLLLGEYPITFKTFISESFMFFLGVPLETQFTICLIFAKSAVKRLPIVVHPNVVL